MARIGKNMVVVSASMDPESKSRIMQYAAEKHTTASQAIVDWIWSIKLPSELKAEEEKQLAARM